MLFWIILILLTAAAVLAVLIPLGRRGHVGELASHDRAVYTDQLSEITTEEARGEISSEDAKAARAEIARRLIAADHGSGRAIASTESPAPRRLIAMVALVGIPLLSIPLYLLLGSPGMPGEPLQARLDSSAPNDINVLVARVEQHLAQDPKDGHGWEILGPVYVRMGRLPDAEHAYRTAIDVLGSSADRQANLGEVLVAEQGAVVTADAKAAFDAALQADPKAPKARFYLGLADQQHGDKVAAADRWNKLLADTPADAPWRPFVETSLAQLEGKAPATGIPPMGSASGAAPPAAEGQPGPSQADVAAASSMSGEDRQAMINGMVGRLADRLHAQPDDVEGWLRLVRAYSVLGRQDDAAQAVRTAMTSLRAEDARQKIVALASDLGLKIGELGQP
ncbi:cytochrome c-type biogenesis protein CcmH [Faunimonas pinastri]|uniref:Cytochrome c-type biogenesis protein CcmH n=1 Tax=Faunimonas pinastri TaxID=1855383 RepID=A0A1H9L088_9HYPH|nr:c-type cytochrome biogenesis protein CcmI [Faunimonas pinastri]SER04911.1 cytochrome c-type biogenesis protein CcmH [Faunimonas pinastri]